MTDPMGKVLISYRRSPARPVGDEEAARLCTSLRRAGIPTWRDMKDLPYEPTEDALESELSDQSLSGAILLISPEIERSQIVKCIEAPRIFRRFRARDGFWILPVLIGLDYVDAERILGLAAGPQDLRKWNMLKIDNDMLGDSDARNIAQLAVRARLQAIRDNESNDSLSLGVHTRHTTPEKFSLAHDFSVDFSGRKVKTGKYTVFENSLIEGASRILETFPSPRVVGTGMAPLPLGVLIGAIYSPRAMFKLSWSQNFRGSHQQWSSELAAESVAMELRVTKDDLSSNDLVLAIGLSADIEREVAESLRKLGVSYRAFLHCSPQSGSYTPDRKLSPEQGLGFVLSAVQKVRNIREELAITKASLHVFLACPLALAVLLGQQLNTFSTCHLYEHIPDESPCYIQVHSFSPSSLAYT